MRFKQNTASELDGNNPGLEAMTTFQTWVIVCASVKLLFFKLHCESSSCTKGADKIRRQRSKGLPNIYQSVSGYQTDITYTFWPTNQTNMIYSYYSKNLERLNNPQQRIYQRNVYIFIWNSPLTKPHGTNLLLKSNNDVYINSSYLDVLVPSTLILHL